MENLEIRNYAKENGVKLWEVAEACEITDSYFSRKLRRELPADQRNRILRMIERIAETKAERAREQREEADIFGKC